MPAFKDANTVNSRSSDNFFNSSRKSFPSYLSRLREEREISAPRTAFIIAISNEVPIAMTSPVAFMRVPSSRFAYRNLSKGHFGSFTTT